jgi:predicted dehydrogenase
MSHGGGQTTSGVLGPSGSETARRAGPWRIGIVGYGRVSETCHLPALCSLVSRAQAVALAEVDAHRCRRGAGMFDLAPYPDVEAMLASQSEIDIVAICTPAQHHAQAAIAALRAGKHVLIEKPLALSVDDADRISDAARAAAPHAKAIVGFNLRHHRLVERARQIIQSGACATSDGSA